MLLMESDIQVVAGELESEMGAWEMVWDKVKAKKGELA